MSDDTKDYEVGYGKPPKHTRFKKGQSGNPKGRPKGAQNVGSMLEQIFFRKIPISDGGVRREVTMLEAILRQVVNGAAKGEIRHVDRVLKLLPILQDTLAGREDGKVAGTDPQADMAVLETLAEMFGSDPEDLLASIKGGVDDENPES